jgi:hypothetical protein
MVSAWKTSWHVAAIKSHSLCRDVGMGKVSVSWHADSSLKENSSIGVFHCLPSQRAAPWDWRIALRPSPEGGDSGKDVLPVAVSTADGDAYFLLGNFNKNYQHCVLAGTCMALFHIPLASFRASSTPALLSVKFFCTNRQQCP